MNSLQYLFRTIFLVNSLSNSHSNIIEIYLGKCINVNSILEESHEKKLIQLSHKYSNAFVRDYTDMQGVHLDICTHHIYIGENVKPIRQP